MNKTRCKSPYCIIQGQTRGRMFTPAKDAQGIATQWCPECIKTGTQLQFYASTTAEMIRKTYRSYVTTNLPKEAKLILRQFVTELLKELNEEL